MISLSLCVGVAERHPSTLCPLGVDVRGCFRLAPGTDPSADLGPLISPEAKQRVIDLVSSGVEEGANLALDGRNVTVPGYAPHGLWSVGL